MATTPESRRPLPGPLHLFEQVWFGIFLLSILFVYCSIGSAGVPVSFAFWEPSAWYPLREAPLLEMTEYEWFNWWPFYTLIGLVCLNMAVVTVRTIPLTALTAGVWMIHSGILVLSLGCVIYFGTKVEGDVAVARGRLVMTIPTGESTEMLAMPGASTRLGDWTFRVSGIDPEWSLLSGDDAGTQTYAVTITVEGPDQSFMRQVIAGYPQYTEDIVPSGDPKQPMARAKKLYGKPLIDETLSITINPDRRKTFYLQAKPSLYLREVIIDDLGRAAPKTPWIERPIGDLPRFNDRVHDPAKVWIARGESVTPDGLDIHVASVDPRDPLAGTDIILTDYLRYAVLETRAVPSQDGPAWASVILTTPDGRSQSHEVVANDPANSTATPEQLGITWLAEPIDLDTAATPMLIISVPDAGIEVTEPLTAMSDFNPEIPMTPIEGTPFSWRVQRFDNNLLIAGHRVSMARIEISDGNETWLRWVFDDPSMNTDMPLDGAPAHSGTPTLDARIAMQYQPPTIGGSSIELIAGPGQDELRVRLALPGSEARVEPVTVGTPLELARGITLTVFDWSASVQMHTRPSLVPRRQRDRAMANQYSMVRAVVPGDVEQAAWLPMHHYPFESTADAVFGFRYAPTVIRLADGRLIEMLKSRRSAELPAAVSLDGFRIASHVGGFTGNISSVLNWHSLVRFEDEDGVTEVVEVSVNDPKPNGELWFFQSQWDPPDPNGSRGGVASAGRNFTVLGIGNRNGVWTMLAGCILSVIGMIYAFYVKPMIKRRAALAVYAQQAKAVPA
jgi:hypothetical protein